MEITLSLIGSLFVGLLVWSAQRWLQRKGYVRVEPEVLQLEYKRAPTDLLRYVRPGTSVANMKEHLGAPFSVATHEILKYPNATTYQYKFSNLNLEAYSQDGITIHVMTLVLPRIGDADHFEVPMLQHVNGFVLGRDCLGKVLGDNDEVQRDTSSKHGSLTVEKYYGNPGQYRRYRFGVFSGPSAPYDYLDEPINSSGVDPSKLIVNLFSLTSENGDFSYYLHYHFYAFR